MFDYLLELSYIRKSKGIIDDSLSRSDFIAPPTIYDNPDKNKSRAYTY